MAENVAVGQSAPDFELTDVQGRAVRLSDYHGKNIILVFTRGFM